MYELNKANGENCQISFLPQKDSWVIASKNVTILAKEEKDLKIYEPTDKNFLEMTKRFYFAKLIGQTWFQILKTHKIDVENLKKTYKIKP